MTEEQIIRQIKLHPILYNARLAQYRDHEARNAAWEEIARKINSSVEDVKTKWSKLRNSYTNALKRRYRKSRDDSIHEVPWRFQKQMQFLLPHLKYKNHHIKPNVPIDMDGEVKDESRSSFIDEYESQYVRPVSPASSPKYVSPIEDDIGGFTPVTTQQSRMESNFLKEFANVMDTPNDSKYKRSMEMDENDYFFLSMSKILKKLPQEDQTDIKFELHKLIYEAEKRQLKMNGLY